jgi:hypothetical protein
MQPHNARTHWLILGALIAGYFVLFFFYYPRSAGIEDEVDFLNQAIVLSHGAFSAEGAGFKEVGFFIERQGRHVSWRNPGRALLTVPFLWLGGIAFAFFSGALIHALLVVASGLVLNGLGRSPVWAALILYHPTFSLYSRTLMADEPAALCLMLALAASLLLSRPGIWVGLALGAAIVFRYHAAVVLVPFSVAFYLSGGKREAARCLLAAGGILGPLIAYNLYLLGNPFGPTFQGSFSLAYVKENLSFYAPSLCLIWPLMLLSPLFAPRRIRNECCAICWPLFLVVLFYFWRDRGATFAESLVLGQRLLQPALPFWIIAYAATIGGVLAKLAKPFLSRALVVPTILAGISLFTLQLVIFRQHDRHLLALSEVREELIQKIPPGSTVLANRNLSKLFLVALSPEPRFHWVECEDLQLPYLQESPRYLAILEKHPSGSISQEVERLAGRLGMTRVATQNPRLLLYH